MDHGHVGIRLGDMVEGLLPPSAFSVVVVTAKTETFRNSADSRVYWHRNGAVVETALVNHEECKRQALHCESDSVLGRALIHCTTKGPPDLLKVSRDGGWTTRPDSATQGAPYESVEPDDLVLAESLSAVE